ncbi:glycosyltransferase family 2 protein, partial [Candidatus Fermentibacterales bacterium]|nr:glycosyltransferase family 2 protein [Candidatus Fermentibacterales bacterium]
MSTALSVLIPVRNGGEELARTLECLAAQSLPRDLWELVLADDGSDTPIESCFRHLLGSLPSRVVRIENGGRRSVARNAALAASRGEVALMMDADLDFDADLLERHLHHHRGDTAEVIMGARIDTWRESPTAFQRWSDSRAMGGRPAG